MAKLFGFIVLLGLCVGVIYIFSTADRHSGDSGTSALSETSASATSVVVPTDEQSFVDTVSVFRSRYRAAENEFQKSTVRRQRGSQLANVVPGRAAKDWVGTVFRMETTSEGNGVLYIKLPGADKVQVETWNNAFSDITDDTLIPNGSRLYQDISALHKGQDVTFSASFIPSDLDYVKESSVTEQGSMDEPAFLVHFVSVRPYGAAAEATDAPRAASLAATAKVPFVGCESDGQVGPEAAPSGAPVPLDDPEAAKQLAYYQGPGPGVLAPRGWSCFGTYGSNGTTLYVSPETLNSSVLTSDFKGISGPGVQASVSNGGTSGRFEVAEIAARVFPDQESFVRRVMAEGIQPESDFVFGPYKNDQLKYKSKDLVEFETPAGVDGLGTRSRLAPSTAPISGVALLRGEDHDLTVLTIRLPEESKSLTQLVIREFEQTVARAQQ